MFPDGSSPDRRRLAQLLHPVTDEPVTSDNLLDLVDAVGQPRHVGDTTIVWDDGLYRARVSTVHLGVDRNSWIGYPGSEQRPIVWETMIFLSHQPDGKEWVKYQRRYCTEDEATAGHEEAVGLVIGMAKAVGVYTREDRETPLLEKRRAFRETGHPGR